MAPLSLLLRVQAASVTAACKASAVFRFRLFFLEKQTSSWDFFWLAKTGTKVDLSQK